MVDLPAIKYQFPTIVAVTGRRPDLVLWSASRRHIVLLELTVPAERNVVQAFERKMMRYDGPGALASDCRDAGWTVDVMPVEVGTLGFVGVQKAGRVVKGAQDGAGGGDAAGKLRDLHRAQIAGLVFGRVAGVAAGAEDGGGRERRRPSCLSPGWRTPPKTTPALLNKDLPGPNITTRWFKVIASKSGNGGGWEARRTGCRAVAVQASNGGTAAGEGRRNGGWRRKAERRTAKEDVSE